MEVIITIQRTDYGFEVIDNPQMVPFPRKEKIVAAD